MDSSTLSYYQQNATVCAQRWDAIEGDSGIARFFTTAFPAEGRVLDVGCGSGRDLALLRQADFDAFGVEPVALLRKHLSAERPELEGRVADGSFPELTLPQAWPTAFDGIVCSAVLMHIPEDQLPDAMSRSHELLTDGGRMLLSVPASRPGIVDGRDAVGRLFTGVRAWEIEDIATRIGFEVASSWNGWSDRQGREGYSWDALLLEKSDRSNA